MTSHHTHLQTSLFTEAFAPANPRKDRTQRFYEDVKREYLRLRNIKKNGVRVYSDEYILQKVADKFYRSAKTIENIVFNRV